MRKEDKQNEGKLKIKKSEGEKIKDISLEESPKKRVKSGKVGLFKDQETKKEILPVEVKPQKITQPPPIPKEIQQNSKEQKVITTNKTNKCCCIY